MPALLFALLALAVPVSMRTEGQAEPLLPLKIDRAIVRALRWIEVNQRPDGTWPGHDQDHPGGVTALVCLARWKAGVAPTDPALVRGLRAIASAKFQTTYSAAVHLMLGAALRETPSGVASSDASLPACSDASLRTSFDFLLNAQVEGLWAYPTGQVDLSNTQFALLGLRAGAKLGFEVPPKTLERAATALFRGQVESGAFGYLAGDANQAGRGGMTAATLAALAVISDLGRKNPIVETALAKKKDRARKAETWLEARFDAARPAFGEGAWTSSWQYPWLWAVERWCGLTGRKKVGAHDWYEEGAKHLLAEQRANGNWDESIDSTCFALLFLRRATMTGWEDRSEIFRKIEAESLATTATATPSADVPRIADWLLAGPYPMSRGIQGMQGLDLARLRPKAKDTFDGRAFERVQLSTNDWSDLEKVAGKDGDHIAWILATQLVWEPETQGQPLEAMLWFAFEDPWKVWLDGKLLTSEMRVASPIVEDVRCPVRLEPGPHALVVLVDDEVGASAFSGRITGPTGKALPPSFRVEAALKPK